MLDPFWRLLASDWPVSLSRARFRHAVGEAALGWAEASGVAVRTSLRAGSSYACQARGTDDCEMRLITTDGELRAVCTLRPSWCEDVPISADDAFKVDVRTATLVPVLQRALEIKQRAVEQLRVVRLGQRLFGATPVDFVLVPAVDDDATRPWFDAIASRDPRQRFALLVFHRDDLPAAPPANPRLTWMALSDAVPTERGLRLALHDVMFRLAPDAVVPSALWPPFRLVADPTTLNFWWEGKPLPLTSDASKLFLLALALQPGRFLSRSQLFPQVLPGDLGRGCRWSSSAPACVQRGWTSAER